MERMVVVRSDDRDFFAGWSVFKKHAAWLVNGEFYGKFFLDDVRAKNLRVGWSTFHGHKLPAFVLDVNSGLGERD